MDQSPPSVVDAPDARWGVHLQGHAFDLADWERAFRLPFDPWVERQGNDFYLRSAALDGLSDPTDVRERATPLVEQLNGAMFALNNSRPVRFEGVVEFAPNGTKRVHMMVTVGGIEARASAAAVGVAIVGGETVPPPPPAPSDAQRWMTICEAHPDLADALVYLSRKDWFDIYKGLECVEDWFGSEQQVRDAALIDFDEFRRVKRTANAFRHRKNGKHLPPSVPATLDEARALLTALVAGAFKKAEQSTATEEH